MNTSLSEGPGEPQARRLESVSEQLSSLLRQSEIAQRLRARPGENEWSVMQVLAHLVEMIPYWLGHCQTLAAADAPPQFGRTQESPERLAGVARGETRSLDQLMSELGDEVQAAARAIRRMTPDERDRRGIHLKRGAMSVAEVIEMYIVAHAEEHLAQVRATLRV